MVTTGQPETDDRHYIGFDRSILRNWPSGDVDSLMAQTAMPPRREETPDYVPTPLAVEETREQRLARRAAEAEAMSDAHMSRIRIARAREEWPVTPHKAESGTESQPTVYEGLRTAFRQATGLEGKQTEGRPDRRSQTPEGRRERYIRAKAARLGISIEEAAAVTQRYSPVLPPKHVRKRA